MMISVIFLIVKGVGIEGLLGSDFLRKHNALLDFAHKELQLEIGGDKRVSIEFKREIYEGDRKIRVISIDRVVIKDNDEKDDGVLFVGVNKVHKHWESIVGSGEGITNENREKLINILRQYEQVFSDRPGLAKNMQCKLNINTEAQPFAQKPYPLPYSKVEAVQLELDRMMAEGIIE